MTTTSLVEAGITEVDIECHYRIEYESVSDTLEDLSRYSLTDKDIKTIVRSNKLFIPLETHYKLGRLKGVYASALNRSSKHRKGLLL